MLAQKSSAEIHGIEIEPTCFSQLEYNIAKSPFTEKCIAINGDVRTNHFKDKYEIIVSNPPFFDGQLAAGEIKKDMAKHSTHLDLSSLFNVVDGILMDDGKFCILLPFYRLHEAVETGMAYGLHCCEVLNIRHTVNHEFFRSILLFEKTAPEICKQQELIIRNADGEYSDEFSVLLKDYYLHL